MITYDFTVIISLLFYFFIQVFFLTPVSIIIFLEYIFLKYMKMEVNPFNPKYPEWYDPCLDIERTKSVCRGESVNLYICVYI